MIPDGWFEHRRPGDREVLGYLRAEGDGFVAVDRLGRAVTGVVDWVEAEEALEARGLGWLADLWQLTDADGAVIRVRLVEVGPDRVVVTSDDFGAVDVPVRRYELPFPAPATLQPFMGDRGLIGGLGP
ncbi:MAG: hypothetical protein KJ548_14020 [Actinobacteria bacterium]|nr:hypothetical protein [Actinomycetota bacterium]MBU4337673.1 hypothetical protein [Actinomycetota bacterium]MCG2803753.1 hypothetical protein [Cellulomonas sp.]